MKYLNILLIILAISLNSYGQETNKKDISSMTREEILQMSLDEMTALPLEDLMKMVEKAGVSSIEELYALLNKDVTSASKSEESLFDSPLSTTVLSQEEILASGATSIEEALRMVPGIIVREKTNGNYDVQIRGNQGIPQGNMLLYSENTTTLVMVDGRPVFNYGMGGILWETLPVSLGEIDRIEVVRGPSSALYGPNAVDGVINLITKDIDKNSPLISGNVQGGTQSTIIGDLSLSKALSDKFSAGVSTYYEFRKRNTEDIYLFPTDSYVDLNTYQAINDVYGLSNDVATELFVDADAERAKKKIGVNGYLHYNPTSELTFRLTGGYLESEANSSTYGDNPTPYNVRLSNGGYLNFDATVYGFNLKASLSNVLQDFNKGHTGWTQATEQYNVSLDYLVRLGGLQIRPGASYQSVYYDDRDHIKVAGTGFFNGRNALRNYAASIRFDYNLMEDLRLVAALRGEKYNVPDRWIPSWQFIGSYKINDNNLFRAVYSRSNQSTFMINAFSNYNWDLRNLGGEHPDIIHFSGNSNPDMMTMDMIEVGYRTRPTKGIFIDVEGFYNQAKDFSALMPDSMELDLLQGGLTTLYMSHRGQNVESKQFGASLSADIVLSSKLLMKMHFTIQQTSLSNSLGLPRDSVAKYQGIEMFTKFVMDTATHGGVPTQPRYISDFQYPASAYQDDVENKAIPAFWGSLALIYRPTAKWEILPQGYYYSNYTFVTQYGEKKMDGKFLLNAKVTYKATDNLSVFVNGRNILNSETQEYPYMDKIGGLYLVGLNFKF